MFATLPMTTHDLRALRANFFEHSEVVIPLDDIRIELIRGRGHSWLRAKSNQDSGALGWGRLN